PCESIRPGRRVVAAVAAYLFDVLAVARHGVNLVPAAIARGRKREMTAIRCKRGALVAALAECDLPRRSARKVVDLDVEPWSGSRRERDLVERGGGPRRPVRPRLVLGDAPKVQAIGAHDVNLRRTAAIGYERDLRAVGRPRGGRVDGRIVGDASYVGAVAIHHIQLRVAI